jgi:integrase
MKEKNLRFRAGRFYTDITHKGRRVRKFAGFTKTQARDVVKKIRVDLLQEDAGLKRRARKDITLQALKDEFLKAAKDKRSLGTLISYENSWAHVRPFFSEKRLADITPRDIEAYMTKRRDAGACGPSVNIEYFFLSAMFRKAVKWQYLEKNPCSGVERFKDSPSMERILSDEEVKRLLDAVKGMEVEPILITLLGTGLRKMEALNLRWPDIDFKDGFIHVTRSKTGKGREVPMSGLVWNALKELSEKKAPGSDIVFLSRRGKGRTDIKHQFKAACRKAGVKGCRIHDLRHTAASRMIAGGTDLVTAARILGHSTIAMTMKYCHPKSADLRQAVESLGKNITEARQKVATVEIRRPVTQIKQNN